jgi:hypothetical protein
MNLSIRTQASVGAVLILALFFLFSACSSVRLISDYDEPTDNALTVLQQDTDDFITKLIANASSEENAFEKHKPFYENTDQQLRRLEFRVASIPKNSHTVDLIAKIRSCILGDGMCSEDGNSLQDLHCLPANTARGPSKTALQVMQRNINQTIGAALALELAKRQGLEQNK